MTKFLHMCNKGRNLSYFSLTIKGNGCGAYYLLQGKLDFSSNFTTSLIVLVRYNIYIMFFRCVASLLATLAHLLTNRCPQDVKSWCP